MAASKSLTAEQRSMRARMAAHVMHSKHDSKKLAVVGQTGLRARFEREVDPDGKLTPDERARRADHAYRAHMAGLAYKRSRKAS